jgi:hypothetical protein
MPDDTAQPGRGFFGWLGRQVGYITKALKTDVAGPKTVYRQERVEEQPLPDDPKVVLRRTTKDEVIVRRNDER